MLTIKAQEPTPQSGKPPGAIRLLTGDGVEQMRFEPGGDIFRQGKLIETDAELVTALREFLATAKVTHDFEVGLK
jgi:hypothetical protein